MVRTREFGLVGRWVVAAGLLLTAGLFSADRVSAADPDWFGATPRIVSTGSSQQAWRPDVAVGPSHQVVVVYSDGPRMTQRDIYAARSADGGRSWSAPSAISTTVAGSLLPDVLFAGEQLVAAWVEQAADVTFTIATARYSPATDRWLMQPVPMTPGQAAPRPRMAAGAGRLHMVFNAGSEASPDIYYTTRLLTSTVWAAPTLAYTHTDVSGSWYPSIAVSPDGQTLHMVWEERTSALERQILHTTAAVTSAGVDWHTTVAALSSAGALSLWPAVAVGSEGVPHVVWAEETIGASSACGATREHYIRYTRRDAGTGLWQAALRIDANPVCANEPNPKDLTPALALAALRGGGYQICVAYHGFRPGGSAEEVLLSCTPSSPLGWSAPQNVSQSYASSAMSIFPALGSDERGRLYMAWQEQAGDNAQTDYEAYYARSAWDLFLPTSRRQAQVLPLRAIAARAPQVRPARGTAPRLALGAEGLF